MADIVDHGIVNKDIGYIVQVGGVMLGIAALGLVGAFYCRFLLKNGGSVWKDRAPRTVHPCGEAFLFISLTVSDGDPDYPNY